jgi:hypothetical protein
MTDASATATRKAKSVKSDRTAISSYWLATIVYNAPRPSCAILNAESLSAILAVAVTDATYYLGIGYKRVTVEIEQRCSACNGSGEIFVRRSAISGVNRMCKACKGNPIMSSIPAFPVRCHENVEIVDPGNIGGNKADV